MHTVLWTAEFIAGARKCRLSNDELANIVTAVAANPQSGDRIPGAGGARKLRHAGRGKGKSGGYRTIHYYAADDVPVFLLSIYDKGHTANLTKAECNLLSKVLPKMVEAHRRHDIVQC